MSILSIHYQILLCFESFSIHCSKMVSHQNVGQQHVMSEHFLKYKPHKADVAPIYLLIKYSHLCGSKYFSKCHNLKFALDYLHFEVNFYILKPFGYSNKRRRWNGAMSLDPCYLLLTLIIKFLTTQICNLSKCLLFFQGHPLLTSLK